MSPSVGDLGIKKSGFEESGKNEECVQEAKKKN